ncbi:DEAD-box ATP-dependent RNA helicase 5 [Micractinium conductrix]|uniref:RNA helicase n=1 Tax=Micractinium conductrix TaxID=554055 RepID=A0A2P6VIV1_9CHLO|nr:DEAD-box ATP-dependent RNA helicase 5 [Micractinium conductrix]|eukprot:PSC74000.1 DEAD-box ATP-dependent RNA helicase 5 [Micractinium conductrix]
MANPLAPAAVQEEHKAVRKQIKKLKKVESTGQLDAAGSAELKALKKKAKALKAASEAGTGSGGGASGSDAEATAEQAAPEPAAAPSGGKKGGKKERKRKGDVGGEAAAAAQAPPPAQEQPAAKKAKKGAKGKAVVAEGPPEGMAAVGDRGLATARPPLVKALYSESPEVANMPAADVAAWRKERQTVVQGCRLNPITSFAQSGLSAAELHATRTFQHPSPIQSQCLPIALSGRDLIGIAATGSGKTLAFGLPALRHIRAQRECGAASGKKPSVLIIAPTRELAIQINAVLDEAGTQCGISTVCVYGGVPKRDQVMALRKGAAIVVATPGRLEDLMNDHACKLDEVSYLVLDEADRMLDLGFEPHIRAIAGQTRADRQTLMFSATWPTIVRKLAADFLCHPVKVTIGSADLAASHSVTQVVEVIEDRARDERLHQLLQQYHKTRSNRVIIFVLYKKEAVRVEQYLSRKGWKAVAIHGDIGQGQRSAAVEQFKSGKVPLLVATDVAARGLDIPDVEAVLNYAFPLTTEDYVHRIGRTGRAGKTGHAHTFFVGNNDKPRAGELINVLREAKQTVPEELLKFGTTVKKKESKLYGAHFKDVDHSQKATKMTFDSDDE